MGATVNSRQITRSTSVLSDDSQFPSSINSIKIKIRHLFGARESSPKPTPPEGSFSIR
jgi:hypothetical protein